MSIPCSQFAAEFDQAGFVARRHARRVPTPVHSARSDFTQTKHLLHVREMLRVSYGVVILGCISSTTSDMSHFIWEVRSVTPSRLGLP